MKWMPDTNPQTPTDPASRIEERLDHMIRLLDHMNRRDKWRTIGGFIRGTVMIIPTVLILLSSVYLYLYGSDLIQELIKQTTQQASEQVQQGFINQLLQNSPSPSTFQVQDRR